MQKSLPQGLKSLCENSEISPSAAEAALNLQHLRHGSLGYARDKFSCALTKNGCRHTDSKAPPLCTTIHVRTSVYLC
jgi:hypothetical protein